MKYIVLLMIVILSHNVMAQDYDFNKLNIVTSEHKLLQFPTENGVGGPTIDILRLLLNDHNIINKTQFLPWSRAYKVAKTQPNTLILSMTRTPEREENFHWITKVSEFSRAFISLKAYPENKTHLFSEAKNKLVAVERDSYNHKKLIKMGFSENKNLYIVTSLKDSIRLLQQNKVQLLFTDPSVLRHYYLAQEKDFKDYIDAPIIKGSQRNSYIALSKQSDPELVNALKFSNKRIEETAEYKRLFYYKPLIDE